MKIILLFLLLPFFSVNLMSQPDNPNLKMWGVNAYMFDIAVDGNYTYIGGMFELVGKTAGAGIKLTSISSSLDKNFPMVNREIFITVPDGSGGWYIAGNFTKVGDKQRSQFAQINSDGSVSDWKPSLNASNVFSMAVIGNSVYVSGIFAENKKLLKLNNTTGGVDASWNPNPSAEVYALGTDGLSLYIGGEFTSVSGVLRTRLAKLNALTGEADPNWIPTANYDVQVIKTNGTDVYVGGGFSLLSGIARNRIAKLNNSTGALDINWNPNSDSRIYDIAVSGNSVFAVGIFDNIGGQVRKSIAKLNNTDGSADVNWNANASLSFNTVEVNSAGVFAGGYKYLSKLDINTGVSDPEWSLKINNSVNTIAINGDDIFAGGSFNLIGSDEIQNLARINNLSGELDKSWNPHLNGRVFCIQIDGADIYVGGEFASVDGKSRSGVAKINKNTGALDLTWNANLYIATIRSIAFDDNNIFVGGSFTYTENEQLVRGMAKLNKSTGAPLFSWDPLLNGGVYSMESVGQYIYMCGNIIYNSNLLYLARLSKETGAIDQTWLPNANNTVNSILFKDNYLYAGGKFTSIGGVTKNRLAKLNLTNGSAEANWNPNANNTVAEIDAIGNDIYAGGYFTSIGGKQIKYLAKMNNTNGAVDTSWNPNPDNTVIAVAVKDNDLYAGGYFTSMKDVPCVSLALFTNRILSIKEENILINGYRLEQNYPNPFNPQTTISFKIPEEALATVKIYDILGKEIAVLLNEVTTAGNHTINLNASGLASGVYFYRIQSGTYSETKKMILLR